MTPNRARSEKTATTFRMGCSVRITIRATPEKVWALLTDGPGFPRWNSTVTSIEGRIAELEKLKIRVPAAKDRVFQPKVSRFEKARAMEWTEGMAPFFKGTRQFSLTANNDGSTDFATDEQLSGLLLLPMIKGTLPDFKPIFETYAEDLARAAEGSVR